MPTVLRILLNESERATVVAEVLMPSLTWPVAVSR
jgi:hypothetical protein